MVRRNGELNLASCVGLILSACIGSALFSISGQTILYAGGSAILSWIIAAGLSCAYGIILAELAVRHKESGGVYSFPRHAFGGAKGRFLGFVSGWGFILSTTIAIGFSAIYAGVYTQACIPGINAKAISIAVLLISLTITGFSGHRSQLVQDLMIIFLVVSILTFCFCCIASPEFHISNFKPFFNSGTGKSMGFISAIPLALIAYGASVIIPFMAADVKKPCKNIPLSLFLGLGALAIIYSSVIFSVVGTVPMETLESDEGLRYIPLFAAAETVSASSWLSMLVSFCAVMALLTTIIALMRVNARAIQTMAEEGFMPDFLTKVNRSGAPAAAFIVMALVGTALSFIPKFTIRLISLGAIMSIITMIVSCISIIGSRRQGNVEGFKAPLGNFLPISVIVIFAVCYIPDIINGGMDLFLFTGISYLIGLILYACTRRRAENRISGIIVHGKGHGTHHGMPTANLHPFAGQKIPSYGVWRTKVFVGGEIMDALTHVGLRPSDDKSEKATIETWIPEFDGDLYDMKMTIDFERYIRETRKFANLDELKKQIEKDWDS
ncbi:MAG: amino acid permease [Bacteroidales bacterium]|nr:amino acid permease [Bacteroidales bacterium]